MDKADPLPDCGELDEAEEAAGGMVVSGGHASAVFEAVDASLDAVSQCVERPVDRVLHAPVLRPVRPLSARHNGKLPKSNAAAFFSAL